MNDAIGVLTKNNDYAKSSISAFLVYKNGRSKMQTLNCNEDCFEGNFKGNLEIVDYTKQPRKCKVRFYVKQEKRTNFDK